MAEAAAVPWVGKERTDAARILFDLATTLENGDETPYGRGQWYRKAGRLMLNPAATRADVERLRLGPVLTAKLVEMIGGSGDG